MTGESDPWHAPRRGPMHWDWRCLTCGNAVADHPSLRARLVGRMRRARRNRHDDNVSLVAEGIKRRTERLRCRVERICEKISDG